MCKKWVCFCSSICLDRVADFKIFAKVNSQYNDVAHPKLGRAKMKEVFATLHSMEKPGEEEEEEEELPITPAEALRILALLDNCDALPVSEEV